MSDPNVFLEILAAVVALGGIIILTYKNSTQRLREVYFFLAAAPTFVSAAVIGALLGQSFGKVLLFFVASILSIMASKLLSRKKKSKRN